MKRLIIGWVIVGVGVWADRWAQRHRKAGGLRGIGCSMPEASPKMDECARDRNRRGPFGIQTQRMLNLWRSTEALGRA